MLLTGRTSAARQLCVTRQHTGHCNRLWAIPKHVARVCTTVRLTAPAGGASLFAGQQAVPALLDTDTYPRGQSSRGVATFLTAGAAAVATAGFWLAHPAKIAAAHTNTLQVDMKRIRVPPVVCHLGGVSDTDGTKNLAPFLP